MSDGIDIGSFVELLKSLTEKVKGKVNELKGKENGASIADMFDLQLEMNHLSQMSETSTQLASAMHQANQSVARNLK